MNCTRVLHALGSHPVPNMCLSLGRQKPVYDLLASSSLKPTPYHVQPARGPMRSSFHSLHPSSSSTSYSSPYPGSRSCLRRVGSSGNSGSSPNKKRVVFADAKGLALTVIHLFIPENPSPPSSSPLFKTPPISYPGQPLTTDKAQRPKLRLGFPPPLLDLNCFLTRLRDTRVQLESCKVLKNMLCGRVRVLHTSPEKAVRVRVTFDSWRSHRDVPCAFLQQHRLRATDTDIFTFDLSLPKNIDPEDGIQFCIFFRLGRGQGPGSGHHWDDNQGQNYRVYVDNHILPQALPQWLQSWNVRCGAQNPAQHCGESGRTSSSAYQTCYVDSCTENQWDLQDN